MTEPIIYTSAAAYFETATSIQDKITKIDAIIDALYETAVKAASNDHISEYMLNNGQTIIKANYRGAESVTKSIQAFETLKAMLQNKLQGRTFRLIDSKSIR